MTGDACREGQRPADLASHWLDDLAGKLTGRGTGQSDKRLYVAADEMMDVSFEF
jgi:hypothetical protein